MTEQFEKSREGLYRLELISKTNESVGGLRKEIIDEFKDHFSSALPISYRGFLINDNEAKFIAKEINQKLNCIIYYGIKDYINDETVYHFFFVSDFQTDWKREAEFLTGNTSVCYLYNVNNPQNSEFEELSFYVKNGLIQKI